MNMNILSNLFKKKKIDVDAIFMSRDWIKIEDDVFQKLNLEIKIDRDNELWNGKNTSTNARICGTFADLDDGISFMQSYVSIV